MSTDTDTIIVKVQPSCMSCEKKDGAIVRFNLKHSGQEDTHAASYWECPKCGQKIRVDIHMRGGGTE